MSKDVKLDDAVLQNLVYKQFTTKRDVLNELCPELCRQLNESVKCWNVGSAEYAAWCHLLQQCCSVNAQAPLEVTIGTLEYLLSPSDENTRVRLNVMELLFQFASNNTKLFAPILSRLVSLVTRVRKCSIYQTFIIIIRMSSSKPVESNAHYVCSPVAFCV